MPFSNTELYLIYAKVKFIALVSIQCWDIRSLRTPSAYVNCPLKWQRCLRHMTFLKQRIALFFTLHFLIVKNWNYQIKATKTKVNTLIVALVIASLELRNLLSFFIAINLHYQCMATKPTHISKYLFTKLCRFQFFCLN